MLNFLTALLDEYELWLMFASAFLSATLLPGNSEIIFTALAAKIQLSETQWFNLNILNLLFVATLGNALGSFTGYWLGRLFPNPNIEQQNSHKVRWVLAKLLKYGTVFLIFSWLPIIGDLVCLLAGWLRLSSWQALLFIFIGKGLRYLFLLSIVIGYTFI